MRRKHAHVWQGGRFDDDVAFWTQRVSRPDDVAVIDGGRSLRIVLESDADFDAFRKVVEQLADTAWSDRGEAGDQASVPES